MPAYSNQNGVLVPQSMRSGAQSAPEADPRAEILRPIVNQWLQKIHLAREAKKPFQTIADQCYKFFAGQSGFMWDDQYLTKFLTKSGSLQKPKFQITLQKAFELVAIFGPYLFWQYPQVHIESEEYDELTPEDFGDPSDPAAMQMFEQAQAEVSADSRRVDKRNALMQKYLNYSQREQPGGGLAIHAELAITEALVKGRGTLWIESYKFNGSNRKLTGRFFDKVDNLLIDPDSISPTLSDAQFIVREHWSHSWQLENIFRLSKGALRGIGKRESAASLVANQSASAQMYRQNGMTGDLIQWYEIWSKAGIGTRMNFQGDPLSFNVSNELHGAFDKQLGDMVYLCVCPQIPWPLNCPSSILRNGASDEELRDRFQWRASNYGEPFPCHMDNRWPVALLDFYRDSNSCWPIAPLAPALGELTAMNILLCSFVDQAYENRKTILAHMGSQAKEIKKALASGDNPALLEINEAAGQTLDKIINFLQRPGMNNDLLDAINFLSEKFDKRTGLTEIMYAMNVGGAASRTARDVAAKEEKASIRPQKMSNDVAHFLTESADLEKFLAGWTVEGKDIVELLGRYGAYFWDELIVAENPEVFVREMRATVEASDVRKPNKERLQQNLQGMLQYMVPMLQRYATDTGDSNPINAFIAALGESMEQDMGDWELGPWRAQPSEEEQQAQQQQQQAQQQQMQLEQAKLKAEILAKQIDAQKSAAELEQQQLETQLESQTGGTDIVKRQLELIFDRTEHEQEIEQDEEVHEQEMVQSRQSFIQQLLQTRAENAVKIEGMQMANRAKQSNGSAV